MALDRNIRIMRNSKGLTQDQVASKIGVARQTVSKWEQGVSVPDADMLIRLADVLGVSVSELLGSSGEITEPEITPEASDMARLLAVLNEELAEKNKFRRAIKRILIIVLVAIASYYVFWLLLTLFFIFVPAW